MIIIFLTLMLESVIIFLIATLAYDLLHYLTHLAISSKNKTLIAFGKWHTYHHLFYPGTLHHQPRWQKKNLYISLTIEYFFEFLVICSMFLFFNPYAVMLALIALIGLFAYVVTVKGKDFHHQTFTHLPAQRGGPFVDAAYHALHHVYPNRFFGSYLKLFDTIMGTAQQLKGKTIALTGASGALGSNLKLLLEKEGCAVIPLKYGQDYTYEDYSKLSEPLAQAHILCLCHGSKYDETQAANCDSFVEIIQLFKTVHARQLVPIEIWGVGSEIECHPCFGIKKLWGYATSKRNFAKHARQYYQDSSIMYRHLVHSAFNSKMGPGLMSAKFAAFITLFLIKRGFKYVPVTYTGFAFINYLYFMFSIKFLTIKEG